MEKEFDDDELTVTLSLDDGRDLECIVLTVFEAEGRDYIALLPTEGPEAESGEVYLYRYSEEDGEPVLDNIEDDAEYDAVSEAFDELLDEEEFEEFEEVLDETDEDI